MGKEQVSQVIKEGKLYGRIGMMTNLMKGCLTALMNSKGSFNNKKAEIHNLSNNKFKSQNNYHNNN